MCKFFLFFFGPPGHKLFELSEIMETITCCTIQQPTVLLQSGALGLFFIARHCHSAAFPDHVGGSKNVVFPSYVCSVQADGACFTSRLSGHEVTWAAVALKSRVGFKRLVVNLG